MARKLDDIFNECYERIRSGESLESCLRSYPQYRRELDPLLRTTFDIGRRVSYIHPRPEFKHWARVRMESAQQYPRQQAIVEKSAFPAWVRHGWAVAVVAGLLIMLGTGTTMAASSTALPTEPLYPVKLATEQIQLAFAVSPERKAEIETELVLKRGDELAAMANTGNTEQAAKAATRYDEQFVKAVQAIVKAGGTETANVPPVVTTPPATTPVTTPPVTKPPVTTPPVTTVVTAVSGNTTQTTTTPPTTSEQPPPTTEQQPPTTEQQPPTTEQQPPTTEQQTSTTTTDDSGQKSKIEQLKKSLDRSTSRSLAVLKTAKENAPEDSKSDWQRVYNRVQDRQNKWRSGNDSSNSDNPTLQEENNTAPNTSSSSQDKPSSGYGRNTHR
jgi:hypothetical protein